MSKSRKGSRKERKGAQETHDICELLCQTADELESLSEKFLKWVQGFIKAFEERAKKWKEYATDRRVRKEVIKSLEGELRPSPLRTLVPIIEGMLERDEFIAEVLKAHDEEMSSFLIVLEGLCVSTLWLTLLMRMIADIYPIVRKMKLPEEVARKLDEMEQKIRTMEELLIEYRPFLDHVRDWVRRAARAMESYIE